MRLHMAAGLALLVVISNNSSAQAVEPRWPDGPYRYIAVDQPIDEALAELGRNMGMQVAVSDKVKGTVGPGLPRGTARDFLEEVSKRYGLVWHYDGLVMHVAAETEMATETIPLDAHSGEDAAQRLERLGILEPRFPTRVSAEDDVVSVSGPPSYIALVKKTLGLSARPREEKTATTVRVFRGRQAQTETLPVQQQQPAVRDTPQPSPQTVNSQGQTATGQ